MKRGSILFLRVVLVILGVGVLTGMLWQPQVEGRNVNADQFTIYFRDPFLAYAYVGSLPFFYGLYQAFAFLGFVGRDEAFAPGAREALRRVKYSALAVIAFIAGAEAYIILGVSDDRAGAVAMGIIAILVGLVAATAADVLERVVRSGGDRRAETDVTA
ncbi:MAG: DUF2975 domain-containing protein [Dehalococcoidia bacterium]